MKVSVAIPTFNAGHKIKECLDSIEAQTGIDPESLEVLVNDDRSDDGTWEEILKRNVNATQNQTNLGLAANWNKTLELASGPVVILFHQDDLLLPGALQNAKEAFEDQDLAFIAFSKIIRSDKGDETSPLMNLGRYSGSEYFKHLMDFKNCPAPSLTFFRKDKIRDAVFYDASYRYCPEMELYLRLAKANPKMHFVHDERPMMVRGSAETQFSKNNFHLGLIDKILMHNTLKGLLSENEFNSSYKGLLKTVDMGIVRLIHEGRTDQIKELFSEPASRKWMMLNSLKLKTSIKVGLNRIIGK